MEVSVVGEVEIGAAEEEEAVEVFVVVEETEASPPEVEEEASHRVVEGVTEGAASGDVVVVAGEEEVRLVCGERQFACSSIILLFVTVCVVVKCYLISSSSDVKYMFTLTISICTNYYYHWSLH